MDRIQVLIEIKLHYADGQRIGYGGEQPLPLFQKEPQPLLNLKKLDSDPERETASNRVHQDIGTVESPRIKPNHTATLPKKLIKPFPAETESEGDQRRLPDDRVQVQDQLD